MDTISKKIKVELRYLPIINFAMQQNRVSVIRFFSIENLTDTLLTDIKISIKPEDEFATTSPTSIDSLQKGEIIRIDTLKMSLSSSYLAQLTERISTSFILEIYTKSELVYSQSYDIDILAYDQWSGVSVLPEILSAFITPNHPAITQVIKKAASILGQWTGNPSLDEYQSRNPDRVQKQMAAIFTAITEQNITYNTVPASFESYGQRIRLVDAVMTQKLATCLDLALLYASCLEAIGIHSLIIIIEGHAFAGGWLIPETFPDNIIDDVSLLSKRIADGINDITLVETTCMTLANHTGFDHAIKAANEKLKDTTRFILALDVRRTRYTGIRPIPQRVLNGQHWVIQEEDNSIQDNSFVTPTSINPYDLSGISLEPKELTKQLLWERKLLDLSLRNNLLNIRITKNTLQLIPAQLDKLEDALADGDEFRVLHKPTDWDNPLFDYGIYQTITDSDPILELVKSEITQKRLRSYLSENDLGKALTHLYRSSRSAIEENGANTLYIALGLLKWYETPSSERPRYAPILLLPVEIIRKSAAKGYVIRSREEDTMMNITLLEMLRQNFGITIPGLEPLPSDESGVDVKLIYSIIRSAIKNQRKWDVEEQAILGIFSFNKFIMWNDIHSNSKKLAENEIVSSLMSGRIEWNLNDEMADATDLDKTLSPAEIMLPIGADSSQLEAIYEAVNHKSFILHGPPGTGKSQTITNIIANALYKGQRVLFVAEKMAALSVVQNRLSAIGLSPFCLELHSNKTKKSAILSQLKKTSEVVKQMPPENFEKEANRLLDLRIELNLYIQALHKSHSFGLSLYDAISRYQSINQEAEFCFPLSYYETLEKDTVELWRESMENLVRVTNACGHPYKHPLTGINISTYSTANKDYSIQLLNETINLLSDIKSQQQILSNIFTEAQATFSRPQVEIVSKIINKLLQAKELTPALIMQPQISEYLEEYQEICVHGKNRDILRQSISTLFNAKIDEVNAYILLENWDKTNQKWFLPRLLEQGKILKQINVYAHKKIDKHNIKNTLKTIIDFQEEESYLNSRVNNFPSLFGKYGKLSSERWDDIEVIIEDYASINSLILNYANDIATSSKFKEALSLQLSEGLSTFISIHGDSLSKTNVLLSELAKKEKQLLETLGISHESLYSDSADCIDSAFSKLNLYLTNIDKLKDWYQWLQVQKQLSELKLEFVTDGFVANNIGIDDVQSIFDKSFYKGSISYIVAKDSSLELFNSKIFNDIIEKYKQLSFEFEHLTKQELYAKLASNLPNFTREATHNSEVGILQRNIRNNARGISIRRLFDQIPTLLSRMCPCMLMSPISVSQYIDADAEKFDLIIFDEASQMPTYEAIGAIARGKSVVIVGDPKQMPPTSFFSANSVDEDNIEKENLESILDDCLALSMPSKYLLWHYRSKHESLIAFSNAEYYDNKLLTFPSPDNIESKVKFVQINGYYDKGKTRQNKAEAVAIVNEIARRLENDELRKMSIGVVTFSSVQQSLIEDLLSDLFITNPNLETLALDCKEPLFIKNLENVQGDERDIILFSIGYGPDKEGRISMNFGPLNRAGGERRLNVAVSRARYEMVIYSTLHSDQIDLNRTSSIGVAGLKRFLQFAQKGEQTTISGIAPTQSTTISIENIIAEKLRKLGYTVHTNVGCSGYKVDIGIVDQSNPSKYRLGIICDGENHKRTKTIRDREIVQNSVLKLLNWNICRIWTMDWWENPEDVISHIEKSMKTLPESVLTSTAHPIVTSNSDDNKTSTEETPLSAIKTSLNSKNREYQNTFLASTELSAESFIDSTYKSVILSQINKVLETEAPISKTLLYKKVLSAWGISRLGQRLYAYFETLDPCFIHYKQSYEDIEFLWLNKEQCDNYTTYRAGSSREAIDLPPKEVANGIKHILENEISLPTTDLLKTCAQLFGFARCGTNVNAAIMRGIQYAVQMEYIKIEDSRAVII